MTFSTRDHSARYRPDPGLAEAADVAARLGMPLLLTGEPGVGKTQAAYWLANKLSLEPLEYAVRSTSTASDLFYGHNALAHYHAAGLANRLGPGAPSEPPRAMARRFLSFHALGLAILRAAPPKETSEFYDDHPGVPVRSVVLLDEIDKAPRDLPNDVLRAVETMSFAVPELGGRTVQADQDLRPIVVVTSNSERALPDAFLRRCIYYHVPFPNDAELKAIVSARTGLPLDAPTLVDAIEVFLAFRNRGLRKPPATAELINFLDASRQAVGLKATEGLFGKPDWKGVATACLAKTEEDRTTIQEVLKSWPLGPRK